MNKTAVLTRTSVAFSGLNAAQSGMKIIQLSDLHETELCGFDIAANIIEQQPDLLLVTGDMMDRPHNTGDRFIDILKTLNGCVPVYGCTGNHEYDVQHGQFPENYRDFMKQTADLGMRWLIDETIEITVHGEPLLLCGISGERFRPLRYEAVKDRLPAPCDKPLIVLCHNPDWFDYIAPGCACLMLSGHVHGGLWRLPLAGGLIGPSFDVLPFYDLGLFRYKSSRLYICGGFGDTAMKFRFNNPRELSLLTLYPEGAHSGTPKCKRERRIDRPRPLNIIIMLLAAALFVCYIVFMSPPALTIAALSLMFCAICTRLSTRRLFTVLKHRFGIFYRAAWLVFFAVLTALAIT